MDGQKLHGSWTLKRMSGKAGDNGKNWLLIKRNDDEARPEKEFNVVEEETGSVKTSRSMEDISNSDGGSAKSLRPPKKSSSKQKEGQAKSREISPSKLSKAGKAKFPKQIKPQLATLKDEPPKGEDWQHELKFDGYRILTFVDNGEVRLMTRNQQNWTAKFKEVAQAMINSLRVKQAVFDGEIVVLRPDGTSDFQALQNVLKGDSSGQLAYYIFDVLYCEGYNLMHSPLLERKRLLQGILADMNRKSDIIRYSDHVVGDGEKVFKNACKTALEGIICKQAQSQYVQKRSTNWLKVKCIQRQEFVIGGYTEPSGSRTGFGALLVGYFDKDDFIYAGKWALASMRIC